MKKVVYFLLALVVVGGLLAGCAKTADVTPTDKPADTPADKPADDEAAVTEDDPYRVFFICGQLGDKSFVDSMAEGLFRAEEELGVEMNIIEAGAEKEKLYQAFEDVLSNEDDVDMMIIYDPYPNIIPMATAHPDTTFVVSDVTFDYSTCPECKDNLYNVGIGQNEGSYLAGYYAALMSETKKVGAVASSEMSVILDFLVGFKQGAVDGGIAEKDILFSFIGSQGGAARAKELALAMYDQGADVLYHVASASGLGVLEAAWEADKLAIGVDSDQGMLIKETNPEMAEHIATSMLKNSGYALFRAIKLDMEGKLPFNGTKEILGIADGGVELARNEIYDRLTPDDVKAKMDQVIADVTAGKVEILTFFSEEGQAYWAKTAE